MFILFCCGVAEPLPDFPAPAAAPATPLSRFRSWLPLCKCSVPRRIEGNHVAAQKQVREHVGKDEMTRGSKQWEQHAHSLAEALR